MFWIQILSRQYEEPKKSKWSLPLPRYFQPRKMVWHQLCSRYMLMMESPSSTHMKKPNNQPNLHTTTWNVLAYKFTLDLELKNQKWKQCFFPSTPTQAKKQSSMNLPDSILNNGTNSIHFTNTISSDLTEDDKFEASSQMGIMKHLFNCRDVDRHVKYWVYISGPLNTLLWGAESWNISEKN